MSSLLTDPRTAIFRETAPADRRTAERYEVCVPVQVSTMDGIVFSSEMINVSTSGFRTRSALMLAPGTRLVVRFRQRMPRRAQVAWQTGEKIGCRFDRPLSQKQLAALAIA
ncbi:MAG TPA: PilZ domain-containing protein [Sphingomonas sp.]